MGKYYNEAAIPDSLRRNYDVYDRIQELGIDLGSFEDNVTSLKGAGIAGVVFHSTGIVYLSGAGGGERQMNDDPERVKHGQQAASDIADSMLARLHWALTCGGEGGDLNDVLYTVKALGMVVSTDVEFNSGPAVVNGFSFRWAVGIRRRNGRLCQRRRGLWRIRRRSRPKRYRRLSPAVSPWSRKLSWQFRKRWPGTSSPTAAGFFHFPPSMLDKVSNARSA